MAMARKEVKTCIFFIKQVILDAQFKQIFANYDITRLESNEQAWSLHISKQIFRGGNNPLFEMLID